jgi:hypothetical protein
MSDVKDNRNKGTLLGLSILGIFGFITFSFTLLGGLGGGLIGIIMGKFYKLYLFTNHYFDVYLIKFYYILHKI